MSLSVIIKKYDLWVFKQGDHTLNVIKASWTTEMSGIELSDNLSRQLRSLCVNALVDFCLHMN